jgi:hypothetical protein
MEMVIETSEKTNTFPIYVPNIKNLEDGNKDVGERNKKR